MGTRLHAVIGVATCLSATGLVHAAAASVPLDTAACQTIGTKLYQRAEDFKKRFRLEIPREFARVSADLDEFCEGNNFKKARVSINWMETCLKNYRKPYKHGFCQRRKTYFCTIDKESDACKGS